MSIWLALLLALFIQSNRHTLVSCSVGDQSYTFYKCINDCFDKNCSSNVDSHSSQSESHTKRTDFSDRQPLILKALGWNCHEECKYECMWYTVDIFVNHYNLEVPQFNGKWPFIRILGMQEPVSVLASVLNFYANYYMYKRLSKALKRTTPFRNLWKMFSLISMNTWVWSTIFHARDTQFTELMDYLSAFGFVLFQFNSFFVRFFKSPNKYSSINSLIITVVNVFCFLFFIYHSYYLSQISFDYGYNMKVNIVFGLLNSICWIIWSLYCYLNYRGMNYVWRCAFSVLVFDLLMVLEIFDFSPIWWMFDSHGLWHLSTVFIPFFWYQFLIDDCKYLESKLDYITKYQ
jgi:hypothetical protein